MSAKELTADEFMAGLQDQYGDQAAEVAEQVNRWLARGDGVAVYVNQDLGHPELGDWRPVSFGSVHALLEVPTADELPQRLPDTPKLINWRYQLEAVYRGDQIDPAGCCGNCEGTETSG